MSQPDITSADAGRLTPDQRAALRVIAAEALAYLVGERTTVAIVARPELRVVR